MQNKNTETNKKRFFSDEQRTKIINFASSGSFFLYDLDGLAIHVADLTKDGIKLFYACKANPLSTIISTLRDANWCFDVASIGELAQITRLGIRGERIIMTGPAKPEKLVRLGLKKRVAIFVIESVNQLKLVEKLAPQYGYQPSILLRLQLQWQENRKNTLGGSSITSFGMDIETAKKILPNINLPFLGFHIFQWGNVLSLHELASIWQKSIDACKTITENFNVLDVGGGLGIPYQDENSLIWSDVVKKIKEIQEKNSIANLMMELGRFVIGPFGYYITKIIDRKKIYGKEILVLAGGINHLLRPALTNSYFPVSLLRQSSQPLMKFTLHGPLCSALDNLGSHQLPSDACIDDIVVLKQVGAYGFSESMPYFLCHDLAGEAVIKKDKIKWIRRPKPAKSWLK